MSVKRIVHHHWCQWEKWCPIIGVIWCNSAPRGRQRKAKAAVPRTQFGDHCSKVPIAIDTEDKSLMTNRLAKIVDTGLVVLICLDGCSLQQLRRCLGSLFKFSHQITDITDRSFPQTA